MAIFFYSDYHKKGVFDTFAKYSTSLNDISTLNVYKQVTFVLALRRSAGNLFFTYPFFFLWKVLGRASVGLVSSFDAIWAFRLFMGPNSNSANGYEAISFFANRRKYPRLGESPFGP